jgi:hypothetical protein
MSVMALEGIVKNGQIRLVTDLALPENTKVFIVIPEVQLPSQVHIFSPRLAHPEQAPDFRLEVEETQADAAV